MGAVDTLRDALFGNPPSPSVKPSREGVLAAFTDLKLSTDAGIAAAALSGTDLNQAMALVAPLLASAQAAQAAADASLALYYQAIAAIPDNVATQLSAAVAGAVSEAEEARDTAQLAADTALAVGRYFPTQAAGEAGSSTNQYFSHPDGSGGLIFRQKNASGSEIIARAATQAQFSVLQDAVTRSLPFARVDAPNTPLTAASGGSGGLTGTYHYRVTYLTAQGETDPSQGSIPITVSNRQINLTNLPISSDQRVTGRRIYRTRADAVDPAQVQLLATINDNTTTGYTDSTIDAALGVYASFFNTTGGEITINGQRFISDSSSSTSVGFNAGRRGYASTYMGVGAGRNVTSGFRLTAYGVEALNAVTNGYEMAAFGIHALGKTTSGRWNNAFGYSALESLTTAENCCAFGHRALVSVTTGSRNTAFGSTAGILVSTGTDNTLIGNETGFFITTGIGNTCVGVNAGHKIAAGNFNAFVGFYTGAKATSSGNAAIGANSFTELTSGGSNTAVGSSAGNGLTTGVGNTLVGNQAGSGPDQKPDAFLSTAIGYGANNTRDKEVVIGANDVDWVVIAGVTFTRAQVQALRALV